MREMVRLAWRRREIGGVVRVSLIFAGPIARRFFARWVSEVRCDDKNMIRLLA